MAGECSAFSGALEAVIRLERPAHLKVSGWGSVSVYPREDCYVTDVQDVQRLCADAAATVLVEASVWSAPPADARPLMELRWCAAMQDPVNSGGVAAHALVQLQSWPDLPRVPVDLLAPVTRLCALLWRKPTVAYLVPRVLDLPPQQVFVLLRVLQAFGHVALHGGLAVARETDVPPPPASDMATGRPPAAGASALAKLWQRLLGAQPA